MAYEIELCRCLPSRGEVCLTFKHSLDELQSLEALRGKKRVGASSMDPIEMSPYLKQAAASFGAPQDLSAFLTLEPKSPRVGQPVRLD